MLNRLREAEPSLRYKATHISGLEEVQSDYSTSSRPYLGAITFAAGSHRSPAVKHHWTAPPPYIYYIFPQIKVENERREPDAEGERKITPQPSGQLP